MKLPAAVVVSLAVSLGGTPAAAQGTPDFLFGQPRGSLGVRGSWNFARAGSDLFDFVERQLTIDRTDFNAPGAAVEVGFGVTRRFDVLFGVDVSQKTIASEYRALVDNNRLPITQDTQLRALNVAVSVRYSLLPQGRSISRFAWVPARVVPYVGAGGGYLWYELNQAGDFVDALAPPPQPVFSDTFNSEGWTPSAHAFGGVDIKFWRMWYATVEGRYVRASAKLSRDFLGFEPIDLAGFRLSGGVHLLLAAP